MASSKKLPSADSAQPLGGSESPAAAGDFISAEALEQQLLAFLSQHAVLDKNLVIGLSGGMDSMALLEMATRIRASLSGVVSAVHVHHGLSAHADEWVEHCRRACASRGVHLEVEHVQVARAGGQSLEERARLARYDCFERVSGEVILLAHHLDDQCETFLLRLLRGSGLRGLAAMAPARALKYGLSKMLMRPLLSVSRAQLRDYAQARSLEWVEDDTNASSAPARNFLRREVLPLLETRFPAYRTTLARSILNLRSADGWVDAQASQDLSRAGQNGALHLTVLRDIGEVRGLALLRHWLESCESRPPSRARLQEVWRQAMTARDDARVSVSLQEGCVRRFQQKLYWVRHIIPGEWPPAGLSWAGQIALALPGMCGEIRSTLTTGQGLRQGLLDAGPCRVVQATSALRIKLAPQRPSRTLKNLFQEQAIPPWERATLPALLCGDRLVWVARVGYDCRWRATTDEAGFVLDWVSA